VNLASRRRPFATGTCGRPASLSTLEDGSLSPPSKKEMQMDTRDVSGSASWNKGRLMGQKLPLKPKEIWAIRFRLQLGHHTRDLALFNLGIDSKLRGCDLVALRVRDVAQGDRVVARAIVMQKKTHHPVKFEITEQTREAVGAWLSEAKLRPEGFLFPSRVSASPQLNSAVRADSGGMGAVDWA
jgi:integrase